MKSARPVIGINCDYEVRGDAPPRFFLEKDYCTAVELEGGIPVLLPAIRKDMRKGQGGINAVLGMLDGLILSGGRDINPSRFGQEMHPDAVLVEPEKEEFDFELVRSALDMDMPVLGICYGEQLLNVSLGGGIIQDISSTADTHTEHLNPPGGRHRVLIEKGTMLHRLLGVDAIDTNSIHHQAVDSPGEGLMVCARSEDGVIEGVESVRHTFVLAVQWHPERMLDEPVERRLFSGFMKGVRAYASRKI